MNNGFNIIAENWQFELAQLDNIIYSGYADDGVSNACTVLSLFNESGVKLNPRTCNYFTKIIVFVDVIR